ncbi:MAG TPA: glycerol-3-phosphate dehydrogenase C-terminal domain-containing protein, partial [Pyrinomonadaceae bacterium]|nr:glycerol-3-phosphate dehydrogenase C-terminal domain-containing protein [Pyrinomonadaceae bacterium]
RKRNCVTKNLKIHGFCENSDEFGKLAIYGADARAIQRIIEENPSTLGKKLHADLPYCAAEIVWATRFEMARTVEDVLARRTRALFLNAKAAIEVAPQAAEIMARELGKDKVWVENQIKQFNETAKNYLLF